MTHPQWSNPPAPTPIESPLADGLAHLHGTEEQEEFRGEQYRYLNLYYVCEITGERFMTDEVANNNVEQIYRPYRRKYGIPAPVEIREFRASMGLTAAVMSKVMGFGPNQWTRYEQGEVPNRPNGLLLRLAVGDKNAWYSILEAGESFFHRQPRLYERLIAKSLTPTPFT